MARYALRFGALAYLAGLLVLPVSLVFWRTFEHGLAAPWHAVTTHDARHAFWLTILIALIAVPANTVFGVALAIAIVRHRFPGKGLVNALVDLPLALSPVVVGFSLLLLYGRLGWFGPWLERHGVHVVFALPGMVLATIFVSLPFVVREVVPVLREIGTEQEQAAATLGAGAFTTFRRITLPAIRWGVIYGVILTTARAIGEYGAVAIVSGRVIGESETATTFVQRSFEGFDKQGAYSISVVLAVMALLTVLLMTLLRPKNQEA